MSGGAVLEIILVRILDLLDRLVLATIWRLRRGGDPWRVPRRCPRRFRLCLPRPPAFASAAAFAAAFASAAAFAPPPLRGRLRDVVRRRAAAAASAAARAAAASSAARAAVSAAVPPQPTPPRLCRRFGRRAPAVAFAAASTAAAASAAAARSAAARSAAARSAAAFTSTTAAASAALARLPPSPRLPPCLGCRLRALDGVRAEDGLACSASFSRRCSEAASSVRVL